VAGNRVGHYTLTQAHCAQYRNVQSLTPADVGGKTQTGCSARNHNNPDNNINDNNGFRVAVSTFLHKLCPNRNYLAGTPSRSR
jgi:hypothetical protein